jgi:hypothetical protein
VAGLVGMAAMLALPVSAQAGRLVVTGHDADQHCALENANVGGCHYLSTAVNYVKGGAPDPSKPLLVLDRARLDVAASLKKSYPGGVPAYVVVDPRSAEFAALPLTTANYSAIIVASSKDDDPADPNPNDLNELDSTPDTDAINARAADIESFFNAGGGLFVNSGGAAGRTDSKRYYGFVHMTRAGELVRQPLTLTSLGRSIGWQDALQFPGESNDINCCKTHLSFEPPATDSQLKVAERDKNGKAVTLVADTNRLATVEEPLANPGSVFGQLPGSSGAATGGGTGGKAGSTKACVPNNGRLKIRLRRPKGVRFAKVTVYVNGKAKKKVSGRKLGNRRITRPFTVRLSTRRASKVRIVAITASGRKLSFRQTYRPC